MTGWSPFCSVGRVLVLAVALRILAACGLQYYLDHLADPPRPFLIMGDAEGYWDLAGDLVSGREYAVYSPPRRALRMPGFPALLAVSRGLFGDRLFPARLLLAIVGGLACGFVYLLGRDLVDKSTGLLAAFLAAVHPTFIGFSPQILTETAFAATMLPGLWLTARLVRDPPVVSSGASKESAPGAEQRVGPGIGTALLTGVLIAVACMMRPSWLLAAPGLAGVVCWLRRGQPAGAGRLFIGAAVMAGAGLALLPWGLRNQRATGEFKLTTFWMGASLYDGLNPEATGDSNMDFFDRENLLASHSEPEVDRIYRDRAVRFLREHPGRAAELVVAKAWRYWKPTPNAAQFQNPWIQWAVAGFYVPLLLLAIRGAWKLRHDWLVLLLTLGAIVYFCVLHLVFVSSLRYRLPAEYPLLVLSAVGWRDLRAAFSRRLTLLANSRPA